MQNETNNSPELPAVVVPAQTGAVVPVVVADLGDKASERFFTFFTDNIRNLNTRAAYFHNANRFFAWCESRQLRFDQIKSFHVSAYLEELSLDLAAPSVKQNLATIRMLFDWLIIGGKWGHSRMPRS